MNSQQAHAIRIARRSATKAHHGQFRKDGKTPYITHPERVARRVKFFGGSHIAVIAAWLHDVMEDVDGGEAIVRETLPQTGLSQDEQDEIFAIVSALTKDPAVKKKSDRLADTLDRVNHAPKEAVLVKLCDRMENLVDARDQGEKFWSVYIPLTDLLITMLAENAVKHGYRNTPGTLKAQRRTFGSV